MKRWEGKKINCGKEMGGDDDSTNGKLHWVCYVLKLSGGVWRQKITVRRRGGVGLVTVVQPGWFELVVSMGSPDMTELGWCR